MEWLDFRHERAVRVGAVVPSVLVRLLAVLGRLSTVDLVQAL